MKNIFFFSQYIIFIQIINFVFQETVLECGYVA